MLLDAMCYWETILEDDGETAEKRRQFQSTMDYLLSIQPKEKESN
tara:strand:+ start:439 stop:573 length:135 start_codon:yes stop_codon:yes gene_type:complete